MSIKEKYEAAGQGQLFSHWALLSEDERVALERGLEEKDTLGVLEKCKEALKHAENDVHPGEVEVLPCTSYESVIDNSAEINSKYEKLGLDAIQKGEVAVILMAGGQGTRLGSSVPKGCFDIGLPSHKSLFQIQAERLQTLQRLAKSDKEIPWFIMTSQPIREDTERFFKANNYFGLQRSQVTFFNQGTLPALDLEGKRLFLKSRTEVYESPDGNGGLYRALKDNRILQEFLARGIKHIHMYCVDNVLVKLADPVFIGYAIYHNFQLATKVVRKRDANELVGLIVSKNKHPCVLEYSEVPKEMAEAVDENSGLLKLRAANIVNHYYAVSLLQEKLDEWCKNMPYHIAKKKIKYYDPRKDEIVKPESVNGIKLEQFIFDVFDTIPMERFGCLEVERSKEFSPLKNGPDSKNDNSDTARLAYLQLSTKWLKDAGADIDDGVLVEVSTGLSYNGESLSEFKGKKFTTSNKYLA